MMCICGTEIPDEGTDYEPGCRFCQRVQIDRGFRALEEP